MQITLLSDSMYEDTGENYGDCILIDNGNSLTIYDCGSEAHAKRVLNYMKEKGYEKLDVILSHNDLDHFAGIETLIAAGVVKSIYTVLLLKYVDDLLKLIDDGRRSREGIKNQIIELYSHIYSLGNGRCDLKDAIEETSINGITLVGPTKEYFLTASAKLLNNQESDVINGTSIANATSIQAEIELSNGKVLLTGDAAFEAFDEKLSNYAMVQLPHHGNKEQAEKIFDKNKKNPDVVYLISDNTGNSNGGSDNLDVKGRRVRNTKNGDIMLNNIICLPISKGSYGIKWQNGYS